MINIKRTLISVFAISFLAFGAACSSEEGTDDLGIALGIAPQNFSCDTTAVNNQCANLNNVPLLVAQTLCTSSLNGTLSAASVKCPTTSTTSESTTTKREALGSCTVTAADNSTLLTGDQEIQLVTYFSGNASSSAAIETTAAETICTTATSTLKGTWLTGYSL